MRLFLPSWTGTWAGWVNNDAELGASEKHSVPTLCPWFLDLLTSKSIWIACWSSKMSLWGCMNLGPFVCQLLIEQGFLHRWSLWIWPFTTWPKNQYGLSAGHAQYHTNFKNLGPSVNQELSDKMARQGTYIHTDRWMYIQQQCYTAV